ncbi:MAG TPA: hypothetical protein VD772_02470, partial [Anseongella sp.]|nr:hypothetical protein [Anseongella sp.]
KDLKAAMQFVLIQKLHPNENSLSIYPSYNLRKALSFPAIKFRQQLCSSALSTIYSPFKFTIIRFRDANIPGSDYTNIKKLLRRAK